MHQRLESWYADTPRTGAAMTDSEKKHVENFEVNYYVALLYLYRPSLNIPVPGDEDLATLAEVSAHVIELYRRFFVKKQLSLYWLAIDNLYQAGTALLYTFAKSASVRERITLKRLEKSIFTCSSIFWGMVEHCPAFESKRDTFDEIVSNALPELRRSTLSSGGATVINPSQTESRSSVHATEHGIQTTHDVQQASVGEAQYHDLATYIDAYHPSGYLQLNSTPAFVDFSSTPQLPAVSMPAYDLGMSEWNWLDQNSDFLIPGWL